MKYMLLMFAPAEGSTEAWEELLAVWSEDDLEAHIAFQEQLDADLTAAGELVDSQGLGGPALAKTVFEVVNRINQDGTTVLMVEQNVGVLPYADRALIMEKGYARVTVQDIIDRADVGRSTFYTHFRDKEDLLVYGLEELRSAFRPHLHAYDPSQPERAAASPTLAVFEHFASYRDVWKAMAGRRGADAFTHYLHGFLSELLRDQLRARGVTTPIAVVPTGVDLARFRPVERGKNASRRVAASGLMAAES